MSKDKTPVIARRERKFKLGIIGHGFVGQAVDYGFSTPMVDKFIVDPKYGESNTLNDLCDWEPQCVFICAPTPSKEDGSVDSSIVEEAVMKLINLTDAFIVIKSTITPDVVDRMMQIDQRVVYHPEFLQEGNAKMDFVTAPFRLVGINDASAGQHLEQLYNAFSICNPAQMIQMTGVEAAFFKYAVNTFLAMKVTFFNQLYDIIGDYGGNYQMVARALGADQRIGYSHKLIPGPDGKRGFGGACFPKDLDALISFADNKTDVDLKLLKTVREVNNIIRSQYEQDEREKLNNVNYGQAKEEQQDQNNGSSESE